MMMIPDPYNMSQEKGKMKNGHKNFKKKNIIKKRKKQYSELGRSAPNRSKTPKQTQKGKQRKKARRIMDNKSHNDNNCHRPQQAHSPDPKINSQSPVTSSGLERGEAGPLTRQRRRYAQHASCPQNHVLQKEKIRFDSSRIEPYGRKPKETTNTDA
ncbi:uncharacterized protein THITE_127149 [Thermothielavioides terrestris NRRL 8126]|uniref:Uncharacterized protein n=1 Tax=Thermothielavioides terrestris (strain ATCC 38088 / NRRL 8126) TaxID=578455 RepID=G2R9X4_THETT|nr:uncharacterized protein THITE_127149 [Thermothielavioides terrestris NRRL 8126]AEO69615.1 hypothetical protein THITE_127149 [Thermothielavioides terrestris NRRL 8126]